MTTLAGKTMVVVGGTRGLGLGVTRAARDAGARVTVVARHLTGEGEQGDATDETFAAKVLAGVRPDLLVITAGAPPVMRPLTEHTWESFSVNLHADVRIAFTWLREALRLPLGPDARAIVFGSAAELRGSPLSGSYAGAKATVRLTTAYAAAQGLVATTLLPGMTPGTTVGETGIEAYAASSGITAAEFRARLAGVPDPAAIGAAVLALATLPAAELAAAYRLDGGELVSIPA
ncbi:SDR family oxidoreductase [Actinoplanes sp. L3-i22]|uniref:SDR family oxidoreductase n=1 Tax=Actinoplanes sp. L3-i22 TaxID=2836373 RepID=UPI001C744AB1|nr:SDR family oxidoreductase [Actinoplanes sp. L3-i22]BCY10775.1 short-chain dehydrogenase [Actinoplanes sp. L3-i22]